jgi:hypothetical protein
MKRKPWPGVGASGLAAGLSAMGHTKNFRDLSAPYPFPRSSRILASRGRIGDQYGSEGQEAIAGNRMKARDLRFTKCLLKSGRIVVIPILDDFAFP